MPTLDQPTVRRALLPGDMGKIAAMHGAVYAAEHRMGPLFEADVAAGLARAAEAGWPATGGIWIVERAGGHVGSVAWTDEGDHAKLRWVLIDAELRGHGLGRRLLSEAVDEASAAGHGLIVLETFSALRAAAHLYRSLGFVVVGSRPHIRWGPTVELQRYELRR